MKPKVIHMTQQAFRLSDTNEFASLLRGSTPIPIEQSEHGLLIHTRLNKHCSRRAVITTLLRKCAFVTQSVANLLYPVASTF